MTPSVLGAELSGAPSVSARTAMLVSTWTMSEPGERWVDPVVEAYKAGVDTTLIEEQLRRSPEERMRRIEELQHALLELAAAGRARAE